MVAWCFALTAAVIPLRAVAEASRTLKDGHAWLTPLASDPPLLHISSHTVVTHTRSIHRKLEVSSRAAAVFEAVSLGLIHLHD